MWFLKGGLFLKKDTKIGLAIVIFVIFIVGAVFAYQALSKKFKPEISLGSNESNNHTASETEKVAALDFTAFDEDGNEVKLSDYFGKPIVLNFWASWCPPCKGEMPHFEAMFQEYGEDVQFLMVDMVDGMRETPQKGQKFIEDSQYTFPVLYDNDQNASQTYGIYSLPTTLFINQDANVVAGVESAIDEATLRKGIELITKTKNQ